MGNKTALKTREFKNFHFPTDCTQRHKKELGKFANLGSYLL